MQAVGSVGSCPQQSTGCALLLLPPAAAAHARLCDAGVPARLGGQAAHRHLQPVSKRAGAGRRACMADNDGWHCIAALAVCLSGWQGCLPISPTAKLPICLQGRARVCGAAVSEPPQHVKWVCLHAALCSLGPLLIVMVDWLSRLAELAAGSRGPLLQWALAAAAASTMPLRPPNNLLPNTSPALPALLPPAAPDLPYLPTCHLAPCPPAVFLQASCPRCWASSTRCTPSLMCR